MASAEVQREPFPEPAARKVRGGSAARGAQGARGRFRSGGGLLEEAGKVDALQMRRGDPGGLGGGGLHRVHLGLESLLLLLLLLFQLRLPLLLPILLPPGLVDLGLGLRRQGLALLARARAGQQPDLLLGLLRLRIFQQGLQVLGHAVPRAEAPAELVREQGRPAPGLLGGPIKLSPEDKLVGWIVQVDPLQRLGHGVFVGLDNLVARHEEQLTDLGLLVDLENGQRPSQALDVVPVGADDLLHSKAHAELYLPGVARRVVYVSKGGAADAVLHQGHGQGSNVAHGVLRGDVGILEVDRTPPHCGRCRDGLRLADKHCGQLLVIIEHHSRPVG
mmetsp:Transcript_175817/g.427621  ORF Transcript_175817/g.427621 Transcript_175817/m.427621 type:complete len:333 (-) Transcript_175817:54-1052(-)